MGPTMKKKWINTEKFNNWADANSAAQILRNLDCEVKVRCRPNNTFQVKVRDGNWEPEEK